MRVLVCGGRDFDDYTRLEKALNELHQTSPIGALIHGDAKGADRLASIWCTRHGIAVEPHPADWNRHGKAAGPIRNQKMLETRPDLVVAFPGGRGTADMLSKAKRAGIETRFA